MIFSHIPIINVGSYFFSGKEEKEAQWRILTGLMYLDARRLNDLFYRHRNVRACISGHIQLLDRIEYNGVRYFCTGAASGSWSGGTFQETRPGYGLLRLYTDGQFDHEYFRPATHATAAWDLGKGLLSKQGTPDQYIPHASLTAMALRT